jgi:hypothetical protein
LGEGFGPCFFENDVAVDRFFWSSGDALLRVKKQQIVIIDFSANGLDGPIA